MIDKTLALWSSNSLLVNSWDSSGVKRNGTYLKSRQSAWKMKWHQVENVTECMTAKMTPNWEFESAWQLKWHRIENERVHDSQNDIELRMWECMTAKMTPSWECESAWQLKDLKLRIRQRAWQLKWHEIENTIECMLVRPNWECDRMYVSLSNTKLRMRQSVLQLKWHQIENVAEYDSLNGTKLRTRQNVW